jgi:hypothetical protein
MTDDLPRRTMHAFDLDRPEWTEHAACKGLTDLFYGDTTADVRAARAVCQTCPVQLDCLAYAREGRELFGVWGGQATKERLRDQAGKRIVQHGTVAGYEWHRRHNVPKCAPCMDAARIRSRENQRRRRLGIVGRNNG